MHLRRDPEFGNMDYTKSRLRMIFVGDNLKYDGHYGIHTSSPCMEKEKRLATSFSDVSNYCTIFINA